MFSNSLTSLQLSTHTNLHISLDVYKENQCYITVHHSNLKYFQLFIWQSTVMNGFVCFCCSSFAQLCLTLCDPTDYSTPGFPVLHYLPELAQTHVHFLSDGIQPSHTLSPSSPPAFIFPSIRVSSNESAVHIRWPRFFGASASVFSMNSQSWFTLGLTGLISLLSKGLSVFVKTTVWKCQFFGTQLSMVQLSHPYVTTGKTTA